jgi:hypothetical protein
VTLTSAIYHRRSQHPVRPPHPETPAGSWRTGSSRDCGATSGRSNSTRRRNRPMRQAIKIASPGLSPTAIAMIVTARLADYPWRDVPVTLTSHLSHDLVTGSLTDANWPTRAYRGIRDRIPPSRFEGLRGERAGSAYHCPKPRSGIFAHRVAIASVLSRDRTASPSPDTPAKSLIRGTSSLRNPRGTACAPGSCCGTEVQKPREINVVACVAGPPERGALVHSNCETTS